MDNLSELNPKPQKESFIQLEEAENLIQGQNFFDQAPFKSVIQSVSEETKTSKIKLGSIINRFTRNGRILYETQDAEWNYLPIIRRYLPAPADQLTDETRDLVISDIFGSSVLAQSWTRLEIGYKDQDRYKEAVAKMIIALKDYPYWILYVKTQKDRSQYNYDGSPGAKLNWQGKDTLPKTYVHWVTDKLKSEEAVKMKGIEEIFPKDFTTPPSRGESPTRRKFIILKASEIAK